VVWNLLSNAVKFTPRGGRVRVVMEQVASRVEIRVSDTGEGISQRFLPHIFERFRQADASTSRRHGGLGLGLALVKQFVELHGGTVQAASDGPGRGSTFVVALPLAILTELERDAPALPPRLEPTASAVDLRGIATLVVEDDRDALALVQRMLERSGATVATAPSAEAAIELLGQREFDVIVSDIGLPGEDGFALMAEVRRLHITTPAIALTAFARAEDRTRALAAGYQYHVAKPVEAAELLTAVASLHGHTA
jgi:CheY-like chemotaxis protein